MGPGNIAEKTFLDIKFPKGHIGVKSFDVELVDEDGNSVPLNQGTCQGYMLPHYWGLGAESRGTSSNLPDPFAVELDRVRSNGSTMIHDCQAEYTIPRIHDSDSLHVQKANIPMEKGGYLIYGTAHMHTGVVNATLYGQDGRILCTSTPKYGMGKEAGNEKGYVVGMSGCYPKPGSMKIKDGAESRGTSSNLPYPFAVELGRIYYSKNSQQCCRQKANIPMEKGGYLIYGTAHMHTGVVNSTLYGQHGRILCTSTPKYGTGKEAGNEKGYVVGMSDCYPKPGSMKIKDGEILTLESRYENKFRTGAMGHFYI
ncbi:hypothetical protein Fmac_028911 [Flemingia macrophylla]|uniref:Uncharacterized protein n=1 Tax=Flemingia macrophylla TaxID=520843 RepID=A0ABD1L8U6_9FABA